MPADEAAQIKAITEELERFTEDAVVGITLEVSQGLQRSTPVDSGYARANWIIDDQPVPEPIGERGNPDKAAALQASQEAHILGYKLEQGPVYISNPTPYINLITTAVSIVVSISRAITRIEITGPRRR